MHVLAALEQLLLPNACVACERLCASPDGRALVCARCRGRLKPLVGGCVRCGQPLPPIGACRFCRPWPAELGWVRSAVWLGPEAREVVHHLKYDGYTPLAAFMADAVARAVAPPAAAWLVPIPLTPARLKHRGFNQAALLAHALGAKWHLPVRERLLTRLRESGSQTALTPEERLANVTGGFGAMPRARAAGGGTDAAASAVRLIIVDDVLTTGATMSAAATALRSAGWPHLGAITFARALPYEQRVA